MVWASAGPGCIIYLAALKTVPEDLIEAATIDGAGIIQRISYITLPRIKFLILIQLMSALIGAFKGGTDFIMVMTGGGPNGATRTLGLDIFQRAWMELKFSTGAAMGWILGAVVIILTCQQLRRMSRATFTNAAQIEANKETSR
jgi:multiple sugar transport system permease protein